MAAFRNSDFASSSSSSGSRYEVFLSFRGEDTRTNFTDHLYHALVDAKIRAFRDNEELLMGKQIGPRLIAAIQQSRISIPIFSEDYASSKWCLDELKTILNCKNTTNQVVLPIFYNIEPSVVSNQTGSYAEAFEEHETEFDDTTVQNWKQALREIGSLEGWDLKNVGHEAKLIKLVVATVRSTLKKTPLILSGDLVGIQFHIEKMLRLLNIGSNDRKIVGINGFGGIGKTTIAKALYNSIFHYFEGWSFLADVKETAMQYNGLISLQKQLCHDILKQEHLDITRVDDGLDIIKRRFHKKKVLIVIDDVDQEIHVNALIKNREWFGIGSRIIVTTRNMAILNSLKADEIYEPEEMDVHQSLQLFTRHAFRADQAPEAYQDVSKSIVESIGGLPLALQVVGSSLFCMREPIWKGTLKMLQDVPNDRVMKRLRISYEGLDYEEKQIFLDTACFFVGMHKDDACYIWEGCKFYPKVGLAALQLRSLITIDEHGYLRMHDQLRDLGRDIVRQENFSEPWGRSRIWSQEEALKALATKMGKGNIEALSISFEGRSMSKCLENEEFAEMTKLRLLRVDYALFAENFTHPLSQLRVLFWRGCPMQFTLTNFNPGKLVVLDLSYSDITEDWKGWKHIKKATNLRSLYLVSCKQLSRTPDLSANRCLEMLNFVGCRKLVHVDASLGLLRRLKVLDFWGCWLIESFPVKLSNLTNLERLRLTCGSMENIPSGIEKLAKTMKVSGSYFSILPDKINALSCVEELSFDHCKKLCCISSFPSSLTYLTFVGFDGLTEIQGLNRLKLLETLEVGWCKSLKRLPNLSKFRRLKILKLASCDRLTKIRGIDKLDSLEDLLIMDCSRLETLLDVSNLKMLKILEVGGCQNLTMVTGFNGLEESLEILEIADCRFLKGSLDFSNFKKLKKLRVEISSVVRSEANYNNDDDDDNDGKGGCGTLINDDAEEVSCGSGSAGVSELDATNKDENTDNVRRSPWAGRIFSGFNHWEELWHVLGHSCLIFILYGIYLLLAWLWSFVIL